MWLIAILIIAGVLLLVAELVLLAGLSVAGICALISYGGAVYLGFERYGTTGGIVVIAIILILSATAVVVSLRSRTWQKLALNEQIESKSQASPESELKIGDKGVAATRLAPVGKVIVGGNTYEARTQDNIYVDPGMPVEVTGFENFTVIVQLAEQTGP